MPPQSFLIVDKIEWENRALCSLLLQNGLLEGTIIVPATGAPYKWVSENNITALPVLLTIDDSTTPPTTQFMYGNELLANIMHMIDNIKQQTIAQEAPAEEAAPYKNQTIRKNVKLQSTTPIKLSKAAEAAKAEADALLKRQLEEKKKFLSGQDSQTGRSVDPYYTTPPVNPTEATSTTAPPITTGVEMPAVPRFETNITLGSDPTPSDKVTSKPSTKHRSHALGKHKQL